ncbi:glycosyltransferase family 2 protein [Swingsia samuiensis]|uniref:Glycosyltransferase family 2 protein n=1 Tax=Swingsia samuiensis TaxID=1293412 RepID=A0A4Y6UIA7_9PROT|nr:glycosyltransferase family 2 protein [Swingsia samuiensis]QDH16157.1 glycosyltransferase family 2 protein [Swingsia samuiensis]
MKKPLAVVTMIYNESEHLLTWRRHYSAQVGESACYIVDHGSSDGSTQNLGSINVIRIPRSPQNDEKRTRSIGKFCESLLEWYDNIIYVDVDELLLADPALYPSLTHFALANNAPIVTATGLDFIHIPDEEDDLDYTRLISPQRNYVRFSSAMCKPCLIQKAVTWSPGFHSCSETLPNLNTPLYLFHLRYADLQTGLQRLQRTRTQPWHSDTAGQHQRIDNDAWENMLRNMAALPKVDVTFDENDQRLKNWRKAVEDSSTSRQNDLYKLDLNLSGTELWHIPDRFIGRI